MPDKTYGINSVLLDSLKPEEPLLDIDHAMQNALNRTLAAIDSADECIEMEFILSQFYTGYADKDEVARGVVVQLRVHRAAQHRHCWALAANKCLWKHASA